MFTLIRRTWRYGQKISETYGRHFGGLMAAAVSFYALLSIVPLLTVAVAVLALFVGGSEAALRDVTFSIQSYLPANAEVIMGTLREIKRDRGLLGTLGLVGLLVAASAIFTNLEVAFNNIWGATKMRRWINQRLVAIGTSLVVLALLFASVGLTAGFTYLQNSNLPGVSYATGHIPHLWSILGEAAAIVLSVLMFTLMYKIVPNKPILWREALVGGLFAGLAWEGAKYLFAVYLARYSSYNKVYGSLGSLIILMVWTYYSMTILFFGAEIAADRGTKLPAAQQEGLHHQPREEAPQQSTA